MATATRRPGSGCATSGQQLSPRQTIDILWPACTGGGRDDVAAHPAGRRRGVARGQRARILGLPAADADDHGPAGGPRPRRRGGRVRRRRRHGPPGASRRRGLADVRGDDHQRVARRPHRAAARRIPRPLRLVPASRGAGPGGRLPRPCLRRALRARHRLGFGRRRAAGVRHRIPRTEGPAEPAPRIARDHHGALGRRDGRLRGRALPPAGRAATARDLSGGSRSSSAARARGRCGWSPPTRTGGTCTRGIVDKLDEMRPFSGDARLFAPGPGRLRPACGLARGDRADGAAALRPHAGRRHRSRARRLLRRTPGSRHRAGLRLVLRLRPTRHAGGLRRRRHRAARPSPGRSSSPGRR